MVLHDEVERLDDHIIQFSNDVFLSSQIFEVMRFLLKVNLLVARSLLSDAVPPPHCLFLFISYQIVVLRVNREVVDCWIPVVHERISHHVDGDAGMTGQVDVWHLRTAKVDLVRVDVRVAYLLILRRLEE